MYELVLERTDPRQVSRLRRSTPVLRSDRRPAGTQVTVVKSLEPSRDTDFSALIVAIAQRQDRQAFVALFDHFAPRIKTYLMRTGMGAGQAEDLAQEALLLVWRRATTFDPGRASAAAWIFAIARNRRIDSLRRLRREATELDPSAEPDPEIQPDTAISGFERDRRVREAMKNLPPEQARVVEMSFFDERPHSDIAQALGLPLGTVKSRLRLAMNRLRDSLGDLL
jgi:RNA polymerase sigma-70 factor, ECF subfamily